MGLRFPHLYSEDGPPLGVVSEHTRMPKLDAKQSWQPALALLAATALVVLVLPDSRANRLSTLDLEEAGFDELYIQFVDSDRTRASIVARGLTTVRRGELASVEPEWSMERLGEEGWLARSPDEGVVFFVPVSEVSDWIYPFIYSFVRERRRGLELPRVEWTTLHVDRLYQGLFLRVALPFDRPDGAPPRRELLTVEEGRVAQLDTWFEEPASGLDMLAELEIDPPHASLAWLAALRSETATVLLLSRRPLELALLPLPVSVTRLFSVAHGAEPTFTEDDRAARWNDSWRAGLADTPLFAEEEESDFESGFEEYRALFLSALRIHGEFHGDAEELQASLPGRQGAGVEFGLALEGS